jgi:hypothetical protein
MHSLSRRRPAVEGESDGQRYGAAQSDAAPSQGLAPALGSAVFAVEQAEFLCAVDLLERPFVVTDPLQYHAQTIEGEHQAAAHALRLEGVVTRVEVLDDGLAVESHSQPWVSLLMALGRGRVTCRDAEPDGNLVVSWADPLRNRGFGGRGVHNGAAYLAEGRRGTDG